MLILWVTWWQGLMSVFVCLWGENLHSLTPLHITVLVGSYEFNFHRVKQKNDDAIYTSMFPYICSIWFVGWGISVTLQCFIWIGMLWHIWPLSNNYSFCDLDITPGCSAISIIFWLTVQPYTTHNQERAESFCSPNKSNKVRPLLSRGSHHVTIRGGILPTKSPSYHIDNLSL